MPEHRIERVGSPDDPRVADYRHLRDAELRAAGGVFLVESRLGVRRLLRAGRHRVRSLFVTDTALRALGPDLSRLDAGVPIYVAERSVMSRVVGYAMHRGCVAAAERGAPIPLSDVVAATASGPRLLVALEDVTNPENVGAVFRNALAFGAEAVLLTPRCADPLYRKAIRVSMGATLRLPFAPLPEWPKELGTLREARFAVAALASAPEALPVGALSDPGVAGERLLLLLGSEDRGLGEAALAESDLRVVIPMAPGVDSLNVATAAGIALHHCHARRHRGAG